MHFLCLWHIIKQYCLNEKFNRYLLFINNLKCIFSGRGEYFYDISGNNVDHASYMIDADTNSLDMIDSDTSLDLGDRTQYDIPSAGSFYKVFAFNTFTK